MKRQIGETHRRDRLEIHNDTQIEEYIGETDWRDRLERQIGDT